MQLNAVDQVIKTRTNPCNYANLLLQIPKVVLSYIRLSKFLFQLGRSTYANINKKNIFLQSFTSTIFYQYPQLIQKCTHLKHECECKKIDVKKKKKRCKSIIAINERSVQGQIAISNSFYSLSNQTISKSHHSKNHLYQIMFGEI